MVKKIQDSKNTHQAVQKIKYVNYLFPHKVSKHRVQELVFCNTLACYYIMQYCLYNIKKKVNRVLLFRVIYLG